jgi:hypothetical protein
VAEGRSGAAPQPTAVAAASPGGREAGPSGRAVPAAQPGAAGRVGAGAAPAPAGGQRRQLCGDR